MFRQGAVARDFGDAAARYDAHAALQRRVLGRLVEQARAACPAPAPHVLDAGGGTGALAALWPQADITVLDLARPMCLQAAARGTLAVQGDLQTPPFAPGRFDAVICSLALQWVEDWQGALAGLRRLVKPGGVLAAASFAQGTLHELAESFAATDHYAHISPFPAAQALSGWALHDDSEHYPSLAALSRRLKGLGARNKATGARAGLTTPRQFARAEDHYRAHFSDAGGLRVTWRVAYGVWQI